MYHKYIFLNMYSILEYITVLLNIKVYDFRENFTTYLKVFLVENN
jgi:hypothetical protein